MTPNIQSRKRKPKSRRVHSHIAATIPTPSLVPAIDSDRLPWTPVHKSSANFEEFDPSRTHPINNPDIEHLLQDNSDQESGIVREGAMVIDEAFGYKCCRGLLDLVRLFIFAPRLIYHVHSQACL